MKQNDFENDDHAGTAPAAFRAPEGTDAWDSQRPLTLPPNTNLEKFQGFIRSVAQIVGSENATVIASDAELQHESYMDPSKAHDVRRFAHSRHLFPPFPFPKNQASYSMLTEGCRCIT